MMKGIQETWLELVKSMMDFKFQIIIRMIIWFKYEMNYFFWVSFLSTCITIFIISCCIFSFPGGSADKESACSGGDLASIPGLGKSPGEGKGYPLQCSGLENSMDCVVHGVAKSQTRLSDFHFHFSP